MELKRFLLKLSGEALSGSLEYGICPDTLKSIARQIREVNDLGYQISIVVGGGNIHRGVAGAIIGMDRANSDYMGMLATVINSLALQDALENEGLHTRVMSAIEMNAIAEPYIRRRAVRHLEKNRIIIFGAGTGNPYFTTDTTAALRAKEINADILLKATMVDGVYDKDPKKHDDAVKFDKLNYIDVLNRGLKVMDSTAISLCMDNDLNIKVFNLNEEGNIKRAITEEGIGTLITRST